MSEHDTPVAEGTLNKKEGSSVVAHHESTLIYFSTENEELILLNEKIASALDEHSRNLMVLVDEVHKANEIYSAAIEAYGKVLSHPDRAAELTSLEAKVSEAEQKLADKKKDLQKTLGDFESKGAGYKEVTELIPIKTKKNQGGRNGIGSRYVYVKKSYIDNFGTGDIHRVSLRGRDRTTGKESIFERDNNGNIKSINTQKIKEQLKKLESKSKGIKFFEVKDIGEIDKTLCDWADSWNSSVVLEKEIGQNIDVSAGAQFLRFTSNTGASGEWDPYKGKLTIKGEHSTVLSVASGTASAKFYIPDRIGWSLKMLPPPGKTKVLNMGMWRMYLETSLIGFAGASAQVEAQLQVTTIGTKQVIMGDREGRLPRFRDRHSPTGAAFHQAREKNEEGASASAEIFSGARAEFKMKGGVQWLQPLELTVHQGKKGDDAKEAAKFVDFCSISEAFVGMVGAGAGGKFQCDFINGRFCFSIAASLCLGAGAKGSFEAEVDYDKLYDFGYWLVYQLYGLDYSFLEVISERAFISFTKISILLLTEMKSEIENQLKNMKITIRDINEAFEAIVSFFEDGMKGSQKRNDIASKILADPKVLFKMTPEAKGILIYLLTRHGFNDHFDLNNRVMLDIYHDRKEAILTILDSIQTQREWFQVFSHCNADGSDLAAGNSALKYMVAQRKMNELKEFLQEGLNKDNEMDKIYRRLKVTPSWGYALAMNNTEFYKLYRMDNEFYPKSRIFSPVSDNNIIEV
ncbi:ATPase [Enterobacter hormaechei]|uniref:ATPase n=1 Tax=Enterobacter hormaechei TaxID=158836 RepID=UPI0012B72677|nr:ATPase [Enterobacter hormaechei]